MKLEYENGTLRVENAAGLRWQITGVEKPRFTFNYDALHVSGERALRRVGSGIQPLTEAEIGQVSTFVEQLKPPSWVTFHKQISMDLRAFAHGLINSVLTQLEYDGLLDAMVTGRTGSTDLYAEEARRVLGYVDAVWNAFDGLVARIGNTPEAELKSVKEYAGLIPSPPSVEYFSAGGPPDVEPVNKPPMNIPAANRTVGTDSPTAAVTVETTAPEAADLSRLVDRAFVFDDVFSDTQLLLLEQWALQTPHWMLTNSAYDEQGRAQHRIWGASYIQAWQQEGWPGLPPVLSSAVNILFRKLGIIFTAPRYIGLNGQSRGQEASIHVDCDRDAPDQLSLLVYIGEDTDGDLMLYDKDDRQRILHRIAFRPNRVVAFDGSIPHQARAPSDDRFRMSLIIRGSYECRRSDSTTSG